MKSISRFFIFALAALLPAMSANAQAPTTPDIPEFSTPAIPGYGKMAVLEDAIVQPDPELQYKLVYSVGSDKMRKGVSDSVWSVARMVNQLHAGGVPEENIDIVVVFYGPGIGAALDNETHQSKYGESNPNLDLMKMLAGKGVTFYACGQTLTTNGWSAENINSYTQLASSALMVLANYQLKGYALMEI